MEQDTEEGEMRAWDEGLIDISGGSMRALDPRQDPGEGSAYRGELCGAPRRERHRLCLREILGGLLDRRARNYSGLSEPAGAIVGLLRRDKSGFGALSGGDKRCLLEGDERGSNGDLLTD